MSITSPVMPSDIANELGQDRFANRTHGKRATHSAGCHGPLCRRAETVRKRERNESRALDAGLTYRPNLHRKRDDSRALELAYWQIWHERDLASRREAEEDAREERAS